MEKINHKWVSAKAYAEATGLGVEKVKQFIRAGKLEGFQTEDGYWKVKVYDNDAVSREVYEELLKKYERLEAISIGAYKLLEGVNK